MLNESIGELMERPDLSPEILEKLKVFAFVMERLPIVTPGVRMSLGLLLDQGGESDWIEIRMEDGEFTLGRGSWIDGDASTETVFEVSSGYRESDAFMATHFAESIRRVRQRRVPGSGDRGQLRRTIQRLGPCAGWGPLEFPGERLFLTGAVCRNSETGRAWQPPDR
jgi:hypothetical protein